MTRPSLSERLDGVMHVLAAITPSAITDDSPVRGCCVGEAIYGPTRCTCWRPIYDVEQQPLQDGGVPPDVVPTRAKCCHDCAYRHGSPERASGEGDALEDLAIGGRGEFWCHQGMRRAVAYRHPDGTVVPAGEGDYQPPVGPPERPVAWKADGSPGERCAGWAALAGVDTASAGR